MSNAKLVLSADGHVFGVHSWTDGFVAIKCPRKCMTEDDALAIALWLANRGLREEAEEFIENFLATVH